MLFRIFDAILKTVFFVLLVGTVVLAFFRPDLLAAAVEWLGRMVASLGWWNYPIVFGIACAESFPIVGTLLPGQNAMLVVAGFHARVDLPGTVAVAMLGACFGNWLGFMVGRLWGTAFLDRYGEWFALGRTERKYLDERIEKNGAWFVIL
jgi:membrane protein DedA with SNARE-associated domain